MKLRHSQSEMSAKKHRWLIISIIGLALVIIDTFIKGVDITLFAFPLNILCALLWLATVARLWQRRDTTFGGFMLSAEATWLSFALMAVVGIVLGTQAEPKTTSLSVITAILFTLTHLTLITIRGWRNAQGIRLRFTLLHCGLILLLGAGFWGAPDRHVVRMALEKGERSNIAYSTSGAAENIGYEIELSSVVTKRDDAGRLSAIEAEVVIDGKCSTLSVNQPATKGFGTKIYIVNDFKDGYAVIEIIDEPWHYLSFVGIVMLLAGAVMMFAAGPKKARG